MPCARRQSDRPRPWVQAAQIGDLASRKSPVVFGGDDLDRKGLDPWQAGMNGIVAEESCILYQERTLMFQPRPGVRPIISPR